jgi:phage terminase large subunit
VTLPHTYTDSGVKEAFVEINAFLDRYQHNSALFSTECVNLTPLPWQERVFKQYDDRHRQIAIKSGHGVGKGYLLAVLTLHHLLCRYPQKTIMTAPSASQLYDAAWNDVKIFVKQLPPMLQSLIEVFADSITFKPSPNESFVSARTSRADQPEAMQGIRSAGSTLLLADEASGIPDSVFAAAGGSMSGRNVTMILTGNPVRNSGFFYNAFNGMAAQWSCHTVSCYDVPHISPEYIENKKLEYGEDSAEFAYRVLGEFPQADEDTVIPAYLVEGARNRDVQASPVAPVVWGLDCARMGTDRSALAKRQMNVLLEPVQTYRIKELMGLCGKIVMEYKNTPIKQRPVEICVDVIGLGAGVVDRLREIRDSELPGVSIRAVNVSESPSVMNADRFLNLRAELWFEARNWFSALDCRIPKEDNTLFTELVTPRVSHTSNGKVKVESKDEMKKRGKRSPDAADAFIMTFASIPSRMLGGSRSGSSEGLLEDYSCPYV